ncbi:TonB-dependent receptor [Croceibacterium ferulae]|uniref:TonB-dependent receptor n=1 Tax=Croceibacterium ferulae TaxID=1854641 RepID=UPI001F4EB8CA|nr:TonB-dependent receptor [Croceibacterium ferulae]
MMRASVYLLGVAPLALMIQPAIAQEAPPADPTQAAADAQARAAQRSPGAPDQPAGAQQGGSVITVTGLRGSLGTAAALKRNADAIIDAIVAQDIGKLPDDTAAESIARIAGVQVNRSGDEANGILIRGLANAATTYNGREFFTAENRFVQLQDFPAQALAGIEVYKSGTADLVEPTLAGLINVRTRRPFDFQGTAIAGGINGTYNDQSRKYDPGGNILFSTRKDTSIGEIGILLNATYAQSQYYNGVRYNGQGIVTPSAVSVITPESAGNSFYYPERVGLYNDGGRRYRPSGNASIQWRPSNDFEMYVDAIYQGYRGRGYIDNFNVDIRGFDPTLSDVVLSEDGGQAVSLTKSGGNRQDIYRSTNKNYTNTRQVATGAKWETGRITLSTDLAYTWSEYGANEFSLDSYVPPKTVAVDFDQDGGASFDFLDFDVEDPSNYFWRGYYESRYYVKGAGWQWRGDISYDTGRDWLHTVQAGVRYTNRDASGQNGNRYAGTADLMIPLTDLPVGELQLTTDPFRGGSQGFVQYLAPERGGIINSQDALRALSIQSLERLVAANPNDQGYRDALARFQAGPQTPYDPLTVFSGDEQSYAGYAQGKYRFGLGDMELDGVVGLRVVNTRGEYSGTSQIQSPDPDGDGPLPAPPATVTPTTVSQNYTDVLPNISARLKIRPDLQLRLAYTYTRERPSFGQLNPALRITQVDPRNPDPNRPSNVVAYGSSGNPNLAPLTSKNYDASLEYYFTRTGFISGAVFYRDLFGFITNFTRRSEFPDIGLIETSQPINSGEGHFFGAEANFQTFLDFLPGAFAGFGVSGNVTYLDGQYRLPRSVDIDSGAIEYGDLVTIPGVSKWTYNAAAFYERAGMTVRLSYNRRSDWVDFYRQDLDTGGQYTGVGIRTRDRLDFSANYDVTENFTLAASVTNILARPFENYNNYQPGRQYPVDVRDEGRYFGLGLRFRFGERAPRPGAARRPVAPFPPGILRRDNVRKDQRLQKGPARHDDGLGGRRRGAGCAAAAVSPRMADQRPAVHILSRQWRRPASGGQRG